ncbi:MAG: Nif3-like dinuclear metal center hexameric protein [Victivallaceae bacterium]|nr:Nif3-like dinuclear metal center hexameric protein [Victivallaceae bacterium]
MLRDRLTGYLDRELSLAAFAGDVSNNGVQIEGKKEVKKVAFGVDGCQALFDRAAEWGADLIFVHHGLSWGAFPKRLEGIDAARYGTLFRAGITLYAAHLPLDAHPQLGNNAGLAEMLRLKNRAPFCNYHGYDIGFAGELPRALDAAALAAKMRRLFPRTNLSLLGEGSVKSVAVVSGGGGLDALSEAAAKKIDCLVTGELTHVMYHAARESNVRVLALGHYASETVGPLAVMRHISEKFNVEVRFFDLPTML